MSPLAGAAAGLDATAVEVGDGGDDATDVGEAGCVEELDGSATGLPWPPHAARASAAVTAKAGRILTSIPSRKAADVPAQAQRGRSIILAPAGRPGA